MLATASGKLATQKINPNHSIRRTSSQVEIRKVTTGKIIQTFDFLSANSLIFSPDNLLIAVGGYGGEIKIWRISDGQLIHSFKKADHYRDITTFLSFTPDRQTLVASTGRYSRISNEPSQISVWNLNSGNNRYVFSKPFTCAAASPDRQLFALGGQIEPLTLYQVNDGIPIRPIVAKPIICSKLKFSTDSKLLAFQRIYKGDAQIYRVQDGKLLQTIPTEYPDKDKQSFSDIALSSNSQYLAVSYNITRTSGFLFPGISKAFFGQIRIWNLEDKRQIATLRGHRKGTNTIAFSPNSKLLASTGKDNKIRFWQMPPHNRI